MKFIKFYKDSFSGLPPDIWLLSFIMLVNRAGAMVLPFMSLYLNKSLGYDLKEIGVIMISQGLGALAGSYLGGILVDRFGHYKVQVGSLFLSGVMFLLFPLLDGTIELMLGMFVLMTIVDSFRPANSAALAIYSTPELQARAISLNRLAMNLGFTVGPTLAGVLAAKYGYHVLFYADGLTCWAAASLILLFLVKKEEPASKSSERKEVYRATLFKDRTYHQFLFLCFLVAFCFIQFFFAIPLYWEKELFISEANIGRLLGMSGLLIAIYEMPMVHFAVLKKFASARVIKVGVVLLGLSYLCLILPIPWQLGIFLYIGFFTFGEILALPFQTYFALSRAHPTIRGSYMGWYSLAWSFALILGPPVAFFIADHFSFTTLWVVNTVLLLIAALGFGKIQKK